MSTDYYCVDLETTAEGGPGTKSPEAHWSQNKLLLCGWAKNSDAIHLQDGTLGLMLAMSASLLQGNKVVVVAHNAKFDIKWLMRQDHAFPWHEVSVWDTMTWRYRHSGHTDKFPSLEKTAIRYGIAFKKSLDLGALLKSGLKMTDIPTMDLMAYLEDDVKILRQIHEYQHDSGVRYDMDYILPLCEMELNGLPIDRAKLELEFEDCHKHVELKEQQMITHIKDTCQWQDGSPVEDIDFSDILGIKSKYLKPYAGRTLSFLLTGTPAMLNITNKWKLTFKPNFSPVHVVNIPPYYKNPTHLGFPIDESVLAQENSFIALAALEHRKYNKILGTYLSPFLESMILTGDKIHPALNTTQTSTGRLSSSNPNGQNMPEVVRALVEGKLSAQITEIDFKQLEMVAVACISGCPNMIAALKRGDDLHYLTGKQVYGWKSPDDMSDAARKVVKAVNFGVLYGGKAAGLSKLTGVEQSIIQRLIDGFYHQFPGVATWQKAVYTKVVDNMHPFDMKEGEQRYGSTWVSPIGGRKYTFVEKEAPMWVRRKTGRKWSFSPTHTSNYPIQGFAGGDLVKYALTYLWRHHPDMEFLLTVHDSIVIKSNLFHYEIDRAVSDMCRATALHFNLPLELTCDVSHGTHWK